VCSLITRVNGQLTEVEGLLQNIAAIKTSGVDLNISHRGIDTRAGRFGFSWNNTFLSKYDVFVPGPSGTQLLARAGTQVGSPSQGFPKRKSIAIVDWDLAPFGASLTGRYVSKLREPTGILKSVFYTDVQLRLIGPQFARGLGFAAGVNNLFDVKTPGCVSCESNNFSQAIHDIPGRYYYARATFKM
jgi:iron complex outermembrane receptor protein